jgi:hypothetical protein
MSDGMYGGPMSPESSFGQGAEYAREYLDQLMRLRQAERAAAINEMAQQMHGTRSGIPFWRTQSQGSMALGPFAVPMSENERSLPRPNAAIIEGLGIPEEHRELLRQLSYIAPIQIGQRADPTQQYQVREYMIDAIMNALMAPPQGLGRDPALLPQPSRTNMYGRFPGRE